MPVSALKKAAGKSQGQISFSTGTLKRLALPIGAYDDPSVATAAHPLKYTGVAGVAINSTMGNDAIDYALTGVLTKSEQLTLSLGQGNDRVKLDFTKGVSAPNLLIAVNGGIGNQDVTALFGSITNTNLQLRARLGGGIEHFTTQINGDVAGAAKVDVNVQGGRYINGINVQERGDIGASAQVSVETNVVGPIETVHVDYAGKLAGRLCIQEQGGGGWDWQQSNIKLSPGTTGVLVDHVLGGAGSGLLSIALLDQGSHLRSVDATIHTGPGQHTVVNTSNVRVLR